MTGYIVHLNARGFGFIRTPNGSDVFFAARCVDAGVKRFDLLREGDRVSFEKKAGSSEAHQVRFLEATEAELSPLRVSDTDDPLIAAFLREAEARGLRVDRQQGTCAWFLVDESRARQIPLEEAWEMVRRGGWQIGMGRVTGGDTARVLGKAQSLVKVLTFEEWRGSEAA